MNINTLEYWEKRFSSGYWDEVGGRNQTRDFAIRQIALLGIDRNFSGKLLDFGCGLGDAFPIYKANFPLAKLVGVDFSPAAIEQCKKRYGAFADFYCYDHASCPHANIIITSNVLEHLSDDKSVAQILLAKCRDLYIIVPYREQHLISEHLRDYDKQAFEYLDPKRVRVFGSAGWSQYGLRRRWWEIHIKNLLRPLFGKTTVRRRLQILYHCVNSSFLGDGGS
mgnify:CR=1 FL=1